MGLKGWVMPGSILPPGEGGIAGRGSCSRGGLLAPGLRTFGPLDAAVGEGKRAVAARSSDASGAGPPPDATRCLWVSGLLLALLCLEIKAKGAMFVFWNGGETIFPGEVWPFLCISMAVN